MNDPRRMRDLMVESIAINRRGAIRYRDAADRLEANDGDPEMVTLWRAEAVELDEMATRHEALVAEYEAGYGLTEEE